jgi:hypothetical protein
MGDVNSYSMMLRWVIAGLILLMSLWFGNAAFYNWWAASGPPNQHPEAYMFRGNIFFAFACLFFVSFIVLVVVNIRRFKKNEYKR